MTLQDKKDEFIRELIMQKGIENAPDHFTRSVMQRIKENPVADDAPLLSLGTWIAILSGIAAIIVVVFVVDIPFLDRIFSSSGVQQVSMNIFPEGFFKTMAEFFKGLEVSGKSLMILAAAGGLVVIERLLKKRFTETRMLVI